MELTLLTIFATYTGTGIAVSVFLMLCGYHYLPSMLIGAGAGVCAAVAMVAV